MTRAEYRAALDMDHLGALRHPAQREIRNMNWLALMAAIAQVESAGNPLAHNIAEDARGIYQIRACVIEDVNAHFHTHYTHDDAYDPRKARAIFRAYLVMWSADLNMERASRVWNGGPRGHRKEATRAYWEKVKAELDKQKAGDR